jgi:hypothetical protein
MSVQIPVRPHVKQYIERNLFFKSRDCIITSSSCIGSYLMELLQPKSKHCLPLRYNPDNVITVLLTDNYNLVCRPYLSPQRANQFNLFVERKIREELYVFIDALTSYGGKEINDAIREFQVKYSIREDDMTWESLKKAYYRYRRALGSLDSSAA